MSDTPHKMLLNQQPKCEHQFAIYLQEQGNGAIIRADQLKCEKCGLDFATPTPKGYATTFQVPIIPVGMLGALQNAARGEGKSAAKKSEPTLREQIGDGPGTELAEELERLGVASCQSCKAQAIVMNQRGVAWCRENVDALVADILPRARVWADAASLQQTMAVWWNADLSIMERLKSGVKAATWQLDDALKVAIRSRVLTAIERSTSKQSAPSQLQAGIAP